MRNRLLICVALVCAALALVVAGCGGDDDTASTAPTKDEFVQQADALCKSSNDEVDAAAQQVFGGQQPNDAQLTQFINDTLIPSLESEINGISALTPPEGDEEEVQDLLDAVNEALDKVKANPELVLAADSDSVFADADQLAESYGLKVCGQG